MSLWPFLVSLLLSVLVNILFIYVALRFNFLDYPDDSLRAHPRAIPNLGGCCIFVAAILSSSFFLEKTDTLLFFKVLLPFLVAGMVDDLFRVNPFMKLVLQAFAICCFIIITKTVIFPLLKLMVVIFALLLLVNGLNLIDISDGLAASVVVPILGFFILSSAVFASASFIGVMSQILLGCLVGFLFFNWHPAKIFLGENGVMVISASLFFMLLNTSFWIPSSLVLLPVSLMLFGVPLAEVAGLIYLRTKSGLLFYQGSRHHFSMFLKDQGLSTRQVALISFFCSSTLAVTAFLFLKQIITLLATAVFVGLGFLIWCYLIYSPSQPMRKVMTWFNSLRFKN